MEVFGTIEPGGLMDQFLKQKLKENINEAFDNIKPIVKDTENLIEDKHREEEKKYEETKKKLKEILRKQSEGTATDEGKKEIEISGIDAEKESE